MRVGQKKICSNYENNIELVIAINGARAPLFPLLNSIANNNCQVHEHKHTYVRIFKTRISHQSLRQSELIKLLYTGEKVIFIRFLSLYVGIKVGMEYLPRYAISDQSSPVKNPIKSQ